VDQQFLDHGAANLITSPFATTLFIKLLPVLEQYQSDWNRLPDKIARENKGLERADCLQSA
jgi:hypothetical protein